MATAEDNVDDAAIEHSQQATTSSHESGGLTANWVSALGPAAPARGTSPAQFSPVETSPGQPLRRSVENVPAGTVVKASFEQPEDTPREANLPANRIKKIAQAAPVLLDGYCPVELINGERWLLGDSRWKVVHQGHTYLLCGEQQRDSFLANPARYTPVFSGNDAVLIKETGARMSGKTDYCVTYGDRLYMFSNATTLWKFQQNPKGYLTAGSE
jgi:YHS domain-containing protein